MKTTGSHMKIRLNEHLTEQVLALTNDYHYSPDEVISMGIALASVLLQEKALGNQVLVVAPNGRTVAEFKETEPRAIHDVAKGYIQSVCPGMSQSPATLVVANSSANEISNGGSRNKRHPSPNPRIGFAS